VKKKGGDAIGVMLFVRAVRTVEPSGSTMQMDLDDGDHPAEWQPS